MNETAQDASKKSRMESDSKESDSKESDSGEATTAAATCPTADSELPLPQKTIAAYLLFVPFLLTFLGILIVFDVLQKLALLLKPASHRATIKGLNSALLRSFYLLGTRFSIEGREHVDPNKMYIVVSNHQSMFDMPLLYTALSMLEPRYIAKTELRKNLPSVSVCLRNDGSALIDRQKPRQAIPELKELAKRMRRDRFSVVIFPEGTRARRGRLKEFRTTGLSVLLKEVPEADVLPVALDGTWKLSVYSKGPIPAGVHVKLKIAPPLPRSAQPDPEVAEKTYSIIHTMLDGLRSR